MNSTRETPGPQIGPKVSKKSTYKTQTHAFMYLCHLFEYGSLTPSSFISTTSPNGQREAVHITTAPSWLTCWLRGRGWRIWSWSRSSSRRSSRGTAPSRSRRKARTGSLFLFEHGEGQKICRFCLSGEQCMVTQAVVSFWRAMMKWNDRGHLMWRSTFSVRKLKHRRNWTGCTQECTSIAITPYTVPRTDDKNSFWQFRSEQFPMSILDSCFNCILPKNLEIHALILNWEGKDSTLTSLIFWWPGSSSNGNQLFVLQPVTHGIGKVKLTWVMDDDLRGIAITLWTTSSSASGTSCSPMSSSAPTLFASRCEMYCFCFAPFWGGLRWSFYLLVNHFFFIFHELTSLLFFPTAMIRDVEQEPFNPHCKKNGISSVPDCCRPNPLVFFILKNFQVFTKKIIRIASIFLQRVFCCVFRSSLVPSWKLPCPRTCQGPDPGSFSGSPTVQLAAGNTQIVGVTGTGRFLVEFFQLFHRNDLGIFYEPNGWGGFFPASLQCLMCKWLFV